jgi:hypothetical protein
VAGSGSDFSEELVVGVEPAALDCKSTGTAPASSTKPTYFNHIQEVEVFRSLS